MDPRLSDVEMRPIWNSWLAGAAEIQIDCFGWNTFYDYISWDDIEFPMACI